MQKVAINLARNRDDNIVDKFTVWALSAGRIVIILTESIALAAFLYRFYLDYQISNLHDKITQDQQVVKVLSQNENKYRSLQNTLNSIQKLNSLSTTNINVLNNVYTQAGSDITIQNFSLSGNSLEVQLTTSNINSLYTFINQLKNNSPITEVNVDKIENKTSSGTIVASLTVNIKNN